MKLPKDTTQYLHNGVEWIFNIPIQQLEKARGYDLPPIWKSCVPRHVCSFISPKFHKMTESTDSL